MNSRHQLIGLGGEAAPSFEASGSVSVVGVAEAEWAGPYKLAGEGLLAFPEAGCFGAVGAVAGGCEVLESDVWVAAGWLVGGGVVQVQSAAGPVAVGEGFFGEGE